jgi:hypothetical protein
VWGWLGKAAKNEVEIFILAVGKLVTVIQGI